MCFSCDMSFFSFFSLRHFKIRDRSNIESTSLLPIFVRHIYFCCNFFDLLAKASPPSSPHLTLSYLLTSSSILSLHLLLHPSFPVSHLLFLSFFSLISFILPIFVLFLPPTSSLLFTSSLLPPLSLRAPSPYSLVCFLPSPSS